MAAPPGPCASFQLPRDHDLHLPQVGAREAARSAQLLEERFCFLFGGARVDREEPLLAVDVGVGDLVAEVLAEVAMDEHLAAGELPLHAQAARLLDAAE